MSDSNVRERLDRMESMLKRLIARTAPKQPTEDEKVFRDPKEKYWTGRSYVGASLGECPADYLRAYAKYRAACAWANRKEGDQAKAKYADKDDATARVATAWAEYREATATGDRPEPKQQRGAMPSMDEGAADKAAADDGDIPF